MDPDKEALLTAVKDSISVLQSSELQLTDLEIPKNVFDLAEVFVQKVYFDLRYSQPRVFTTLLPLCNHLSLTEAIPEVKSWQQGLKALLRYPINLLLAPSRPELKCVKVSRYFTEKIQVCLFHLKLYYSHITCLLRPLPFAHRCFFLLRCILKPLMERL